MRLLTVAIGCLCAVGLQASPIDPAIDLSGGLLAFSATGRTIASFPAGFFGDLNGVPSNAFQGGIDLTGVPGAVAVPSGQFSNAAFSIVLADQPGTLALTPAAPGQASAFGRVLSSLALTGELGTPASGAPSGAPVIAIDSGQFAGTLQVPFGSATEAFDVIATLGSTPVLVSPRFFIPTSDTGGTLPGVAGTGSFLLTLTHDGVMRSAVGSFAGETSTGTGTGSFSVSAPVSISTPAGGAAPTVSAPVLPSEAAAAAATAVSAVSASVPPSVGAGAVTSATVLPTAVPEPATWALLGTGILALAGLRRLLKGRAL